MKAKDMENKLRQAFRHASSDLYQDILADCKNEGNGINMNTTDNREPKRIGRKSWPRSPWAAVTAALILVVVGLLGFQQIRTNQVASIITMDLNPSIQLDINRTDRILHARALNAEGELVLDDMDLNKVDLDVAVNAIVGSMYKNGYLAAEIVTLLVSVENKSDEKTSALLEKIVDQLETLMESNGLESTILSQKLRMDAELEALAEKHQISAGKAYLVNHLHSKHPTIPVEVLSAMEMGELVDLFLNTIVHDDDIELHGSAAVDSSQETVDRALVLTRLFELWQLDPAGIRSATIDLDDDHLTYDVEVTVSSKEFKASVDAKTGEILVDERDDDPEQTMMLSATEARRMVVDRFGGIIQKIEYAYDDNYPMYKGEALKAGNKVVFEINAKTKNWVKWDTSNEDTWNDFAKALPNMVTMNQAADSVISKSGHAGTFIQKMDFLWDDSEPLYQGEAFSDGFKYSFEIYAYSGNFQKWDVDSDDDTWAEKYYNVQTSLKTTPAPTATPTVTVTPVLSAISTPTATPLPTVTPAQAAPTQSAMLSATEARRMVVDRFGGIIQKIEYAYDDAYPMYKGEALKAGFKVVFEINARTKNWSKWDTSNEDTWNDFAHALPNLITMDQAADSVIRQSGNANTFIQKVDFLWDDSEPLYQGEAFSNGTKYSFEIYAYGGNFQKWDIDTDDDTWAEKYYNVR